MLDPDHFGSQHRLYFLWRLVEQKAITQHSRCMDDSIQVPVLHQDPLDKRMYGRSIVYVYLLIVDTYARAGTSARQILCGGQGGDLRDADRGKPCPYGPRPRPCPCVRECRSTYQDNGRLLHMPSDLFHKELG